MSRGHSEDVRAECGEDFEGEVALDAADDLGLGQSVGCFV